MSRLARLERLRAIAQHQEHRDEFVVVDAECRTKLGLPVTYDLYEELLGDIESDQVLLDAVLEVVFREARRQGRPLAQAREEFLVERPHLDSAVDRCTLLNDLFWSSPSGEAVNLVPHVPSGTEFGPRLDSGRKRFRLLDPIGTGSTSAVYRAEDRHLESGDDRPLVAVKLFNAAGDSLNGERIRQEAAFAAKISHPNVATIFDWGISGDGRAYIVSELIPDGSLESLIDSNNRSMTVRQWVGLFADLADGLHALHAAGLIHRDLKPANVLIRVIERGHSTRYQPTITDFGSARQSRNEEGDLLLDTSGNVAFRAPERADAKGRPTPVSDVYALAALLQYSLTRELPDHTHMHASEVAGAASVPGRLGRIIEQGMAQDPAARIGSASEFSQALRGWLDHRPINGMNTGLLHRLGLWARRHPVWATAVLSSAMLTGVGTASVVQQRIHSAYATGHQDAAESLRPWLSLADRDIQSVSVFRDWLTVTLFTHWTSENSFLDTLLEHEGSNERTIAAIEDWIASMEQATENPGLESMVWRLSLLVLQLSSKDPYPQSQQHLERVTDYFVQRTDRGDPILQTLDVLRAVHTVKHHKLNGPDSQYDQPDLHSSLNAMIGYLASRGIESPAQISDEYVHDPLVRLSLRGIWHVTGESMLDDQPMRRWAEREVKRLSR